MENVIRGFKLVKNAPEGAKLPERKTGKSAGYDFVLPIDVTVPAKGYSNIVFTGVKAKMPADEVLLLTIRSSVGIKRRVTLANNLGVIDADYYDNPENEGNIGIALYNGGNVDQSFKAGERIMQGIFVKYGVCDVDVASDTRQGGIGSTDESVKKSQPRTRRAKAAEKIQ